MCESKSTKVISILAYYHSILLHIFIQILNIKKHKKEAQRGNSDLYLRESCPVVASMWLLKQKIKMCVKLLFFLLLMHKTIIFKNIILIKQLVHRAGLTITEAFFKKC